MNDISPLTRWTVVRHALREALPFGVKLYPIGDTVEIEGDLPATLRTRLDPVLLYDYLGAAKADAIEITFANKLGVEPVLVEDAKGLIAATVELADCDTIAIDFETGAPGWRPKPARLNQNGGLAATQPAQDPQGLYPHKAIIELAQLYGGGERAFLFRAKALQMLMRGTWLRQQRLVAHNAAFELAFAQHHFGFTPAQPMECSMLAAGLIYGPERSLAATAQHALGITPPKGMAKTCWGAPRLSPGQIAYALSDVALGWRAWRVLEQKLQELGLMAAYHLLRDALPATVAMQLRGLGFNPPAHTRQTKLWGEGLAEARRRYLDLAGDRLPPLSAPVKPAEIRAWLQIVAPERIATWTKTSKAGLLSTKGGHLKRLADVPTAKPLLRILQLEKLWSTFGPSLPEHVAPDGRIHAIYKISEAKTGRFSCSGPNLQQLPQQAAPEFKGCIVAASGNVLVGADYSQIDLRAAAWKYADPALTAVFANGEDVHAVTAAQMLGIPVSAVTPDQRKPAKPINFGAIYGAQAPTLAQNAFMNWDIDMSVQTAEEWRNAFFARYPVLHAGLEAHAEQCLHDGCNGYIELSLGRLWLAEWEIETNGHLTKPQTYNLPLQGLAADCMLRALPLVDQGLTQAGIAGSSGIVAIIHDEILTEVAEDQAEIAAEILKGAMLEAFEKTMPGAPTRGLIEVKTGRTWRDLK